MVWNNRQLNKWNNEAPIIPLKFYLYSKDTQIFDQNLQTIDKIDRMKLGII